LSPSTKRWAVAGKLSSPQPGPLPAAEVKILRSSDQRRGSFLRCSKECRAPA
jgi:hypothetical protein